MRGGECHPQLHVEQFLELKAIDSEIRKLDAAQGESVDALLARIAPNVVELPRVGDGSGMSAGLSVLRRRSWLRSAALAATLILSLASIWYFAAQRPVEFMTTVGEQRTVTLSDGSVITLNALSTVEIDYSRSRRDVQLKTGEAAFRVAHDSSRPFIVHTPSAVVRAVGTQFNVKEQPGGAVVSVLEGRVQVVPVLQASVAGAASEVPKTIELGAGEEGRVVAGGTVSKRQRQDMGSALAWRERKLHFEDTPLDEIVREFNRYGQSVQLKTQGIPAGSRRYGGIFEADDPDSFAQTLAREPDLIVERKPGQIIIRNRVRPRAP